MSSRIPLDALFAAYLHDLSEMARLACEEQEKGLRSAQSLVGKLVLESVRLSIYERMFLLPAVAEALPDGVALARTTAAKLDEIEQRASRLEGLDHAEGAALEPLQALRTSVDDLARDQRSTLLPALCDALPEKDLVRLGERVTPTQESGATHSHPKVTGGHDLTLWPQRGATAALREVFTAEVTNRSTAAAI